MIYFWEGMHAPKELFWVWDKETSPDLIQGLTESSGENYFGGFTFNRPPHHPYFMVTRCSTSK